MMIDIFLHEPQSRLQIDECIFVGHDGERVCFGRFTCLHGFTDGGETDGERESTIELMDMPWEHVKNERCTDMP